MATIGEYESAYRALALCLAARVPVILWGPPGQGKSSVIRAIAQDQDRYMEQLVASIREPQDFAGLPVVIDGTTRLMPPDWALRLSRVQDGILFTDEVNTAPPSVQAALLRVSLDKVAGDCDLGADTSVVAAANPPELAADGWDLAPPLANRFCHLPWELPAEVLRDGIGGNWPTYPIQMPDPDLLQRAIDDERARLAGFMAARPDLCTVLPRTAAEQGRAFPTPRSWEMAVLLSGWATATEQPEGVRRMLVRGCVGPGATAEFLTYRENLDLPEPESVLADPMGAVLPTRADLVYVVGAGVLAVLRAEVTPARWHATGFVLERIAGAGHPDIAMAFARDWIRLRPETERPQSGVLQALIPLLAEADQV